MKNLLLPLVFLLLPLVGVSQNDSLATEIMNYSPAPSDVISKGRRLLTDALVAGDFDKVAEVRSYLLKEVDTEEYLVFYPAEDWLLLYWSEEYDELLAGLKSFDEEMIAELSSKVLPPQDQLFYKQVEKSLLWRDKLEFGIWRASLSEEQKDFLKLNLAWLLDDESQPDYLDTLNARADEFLGAYPDSEYEDYVRQQLRHKYVASDWGFGFEFFSGYSLFTGELSNSFTNAVPIGFDFDIEYRKWTLYMRLIAGIGETATDISDGRGRVWEEGVQANSVVADFSFGYAAVENDRIKFSPFAGIGVAQITAPEKQLEENPDLEHMAVGSDISYSVGANLDFKLGWDTGESILNKKTYWFVRVRYGYTMPQFSDPYSGGMHSLTLGLGGVFRSLKREL